MSSFNNNLPYWSPQMNKSGITGSGVVTASGANNCYIVGRDTIVRIVPSTDTYVNFADASDVVSLLLASAANGPILKAGVEYFIGSAGNRFMSLSSTAGSVILINQDDFE